MVKLFNLSSARSSAWHILFLAISLIDMLPFFAVLISLLKSVKGEDICLRYKTGGAPLKQDIEHISDEPEIITLRGKYDYRKHNIGVKDDFNGFLLARDGSVLDDEADIIVFNKRPIPEVPANETDRYTAVNTFLRRCCDKEGYYLRTIFEESVYSREKLNIYQLVFKNDLLHLTINGKTVELKKPAGVQDKKLWEIGHIRRRGRATNFIDVTVCPFRVKVIVRQEPSLVDMKKKCEAGFNCENGREIFQEFGKEVRMSCFASGPPTLELRWELNGVERPNAEERDDAGISLSQLVIESLDESSVGNYSCIATNVFNKTLNSRAFVNVAGLGPISMYIKPGRMSEITCNESDQCGVSTDIVARFIAEEVSLSCKAFGSYPIRLSWSTDGKDLDGVDTYVINRPQNLSDISFTVTKNTTGLYYCHAVYDVYRKNPVNISVNVIGYDPISLNIISAHLSEITCNGREDCQKITRKFARSLIGEEINLSCKAAGSHPLRLWWSLQGKDLSSRETYRFNESNDLVEITFTVTKGTEGRYNCQAFYNDFNQTVVNRTVEVIGYDPIVPHISSARAWEGQCDESRNCKGRVEKFTRLIGEDITLNCEIVASHPTNASWSSGGKDLTDRSTHQIEKAGDQIRISFTVTTNTTGRYNCHAVYNDFDQIRAKTSVDVVGYERISLFILPGPSSEFLCNDRDDCSRVRVFSVERLVSEKITLSCKGFGSHPLDVWWSFGGKNLTNGMIYRIKSAQNYSEVSFTAKEDSGGSYKCNAAYTFNSSITENVFMDLNVVFPATVHIEEPKYVVTTPGNSVRFRCFIYQFPFKSGTGNWRHLNSMTHTRRLSESHGFETDAEGRKYVVRILEFENVQDADSGVFTCGVDGIVDVASLFVETVVETPLVNYSHTEPGKMEFTCSTRANPPATLNLSVSVDEPGKEQDLGLTELTATSRGPGHLVQKTWSLETPQQHFKILFVCVATQSRRRRELSGHITLTRPLKTDVKFTSSNATELNVRNGESFAVTCKASGSPPPKLLMLIRNGHEVVGQMINDDQYKYEIVLNATFENATIDERGWYSCEASHTDNVTALLSNFSNNTASNDDGWKFCRNNNSEDITVTNSSTGERWSINEYGYWRTLTNSSGLLTDNDTRFTRDNQTLNLTREEIDNGTHWHSCRDDGKKGEISSVRVNILIYQELSSLRISFIPDFEQRDGVINFADNSYIQARCTSRGGSPMPRLVLLLNNEVLDGQSEFVGDIALTQAVLRVSSNFTLNFKCEAWQDKFGEEVAVRSRTVKIIASQKDEGYEAQVSKSGVIYKIIYWGLWTAVGLVGLGLLIAMGLVAYLCFPRRKREDLTPLSSSEEVRIRTQSIDWASRRMELLSNLNEHRVSSPSTRITRSMSRSREGLESIRQRQRTQSGDTLEGSHSRQRTESGDLVQDEADWRQRAQTGDKVFDHESRSIGRERHTSC